MVLEINLDPNQRQSMQTSSVEKSECNIKDEKIGDGLNDNKSQPDTPMTINDQVQANNDQIQNEKSNSNDDSQDEAMIENEDVEIQMGDEKCASNTELTVQ